MGDANLDGVTVADLNVVLSNYNKPGDTWYQGDFNYDGVGQRQRSEHRSVELQPGPRRGCRGPGTVHLLLAAAGLAALLAYGWRKRK